MGRTERNIGEGIVWSMTDWYWYIIGCLRNAVCISMDMC